MRIFQRKSATALALLALAGCLTPSKQSSDVRVHDMKPNGNNSASELPADDTVRACYATGKEMEKQGFYADAAVQYAKAQSLAPDRVEITVRLGAAYDRLGMTEKAAIEFNRAVKAAPKNADVLNDAGYFLARQGKWSEAEAHLKRATQIDPKNARAWVNLGTVFAKTGRVDESLQAFTHAVSSSEAKYNAGVILAGIGEKAKAQTLLAEALKDDPALKQASTALTELQKPTEAH